MLEILITLAKLVRPFEGLAKKLANGSIGPYICPAGYWTRGYGIRVKDGNAPAITTAEAEVELFDKLPYYVNEAIRICPRLVKYVAGPGYCPLRVAAIADFVFNLGPGAFAASTLKKRLDREDWEAACRELPKWVYGGGRVLPGLVLRRAAEIKLIRTTL
jgi:lysozyme